MSKLDTSLSPWGDRVKSQLSKLDVKSLGRVGVLLGGRSGEREISLMSGNGILEALLSKGVDVHSFDPGLRCPTELAKEKFDRVFSGHYHTRSNNGRIFYLGNPYQMFWNDVNDARGFHIFDTETLELEAIDNPFTLYEIIYYNDTPRQLVKFTDYTNKIVKVVVKQKSNEKEYDRFLDALMKVNPYDVKIVEKVDNISFDDEIVNQTEDTMTLLDKYVDDLETDLNKSKIKSLIKNIYQEACEVM